MPWSVSVLQNPTIIFTTYSGIVTPQELSIAFDLAIRTAITEQTSMFLTDCSTLEGGHTVFDLYQLIETIGNYDIRFPLKEAVILPANAAAIEDVRFYENAVYNRGMNIQVFSDPTLAQQWLIGDQPNPS